MSLAREVMRLNDEIYQLQYQVFKQQKDVKYSESKAANETWKRTQLENQLKEQNADLEAESKMRFQLEEQVKEKAVKLEAESKIRSRLEDQVKEKTVKLEAESKIRSQLEEQLEEQALKLEMESQLRSQFEMEVERLKLEIVRIGRQSLSAEGCSQEEATINPSTSRAVQPESGGQEPVGDEMELYLDEDGENMSEMTCDTTWSSQTGSNVKTSVLGMPKIVMNRNGAERGPEAALLAGKDRKKHGRCPMRPKAMIPKYCLCGHFSYTEFALKRHMIKYMYGKVFKCSETPSCGMTFRTVKQLGEHALESHKIEYLDKYGCSMCGSMFEELPQLKKHEKACALKAKLDVAMKWME